MCSGSILFPELFGRGLRSGSFLPARALTIAYFARQQLRVTRTSRVAEPSGCRILRLMRKIPKCRDIRR